MTGVMLGAAANHCLTIIDGFNSTASAFIAKALSEESVQYLMASHLSLEQAHRKSLKVIGLTEYIDLDIVLGKPLAQVYKRKYWIWRLLFIKTARIKEREWQNERNTGTG